MTSPGPDQASNGRHHAFGMHARSQVRFDHITDDLSERFGLRYLREVEDRARRMCAEVASGDEALLANPGLVGACAQ